MSIASRHPLLWLGLLAAFAATSAWGYAMTYDASGNMLTRSGGGQTWSAKWAGFDKPRWLAKNAAGSEFVYGASRDRVIHLEFDAMSGGAPSRYLRKKLYPLGKTVELDYVNTASSGQAWLLDTVRLYVPGPEGLLGAMEFSPSVPVGPPTKACVYHYDHLGSIQSVTDHADATLQRALDGVGKPSLYSYDPWGERRDPGDWLGKPSATADGGADDVTPRGFTGHEMLDDLGLVHMNGRIYDPLLGRFLSADLVIPDPTNLQFFNRYSYVGNNPLSMTDPTGYNPWANDSAGTRAMVQPLVPESPRGRATYGLIGNLLEMLGLGAAEAATAGAATPAVVVAAAFVADDTAANLKQFVTNEDQRTIRGGAANDVVTSLGGSEALAGNVELAVNVGTTGLAAGVLMSAVAKTEGAAVQALADAKVQPKLATEVAESAPTAKTPVGMDGNPQGMPDRVYIKGSTTDNNLTPRPGKDEGMLSSFDTVANPIDSKENPIFATGKDAQNVQVVDTSKLPAGSVVPDGGLNDAPPGHVSIGPDLPAATVRDAIVETIQKKEFK